MYLCFFNACIPRKLVMQGAVRLQVRGALLARSARSGEWGGTSAALSDGPTAGGFCDLRMTRLYIRSISHRVVS